MAACTKCHNMPRYNLWRAREIATFLSKCTCCTWIIGFVAVAWPIAAKSLCWLSLPEPVSQEHTRSPDCASNLCSLSIFPFLHFKIAPQKTHTQIAKFYAKQLWLQVLDQQTPGGSTLVLSVAEKKITRLHFIPVGVFAQRRVIVARAEFGKFKHHLTWHRPWYLKTDGRRDNI